MNVTLYDTLFKTLLHIIQYLILGVYYLGFSMLSKMLNYLISNLVTVALPYDYDRGVIIEISLNFGEMFNFISLIFINNKNISLD